MLKCEVFIQGHSLLNQESSGDEGCEIFLVCYNHPLYRLITLNRFAYHHNQGCEICLRTHRICFLLP
ncbi:hypothetical protein HanHA300_Chr13g0474081 [Helianthus annuus]|nr:hypothetical protein HanHA300_Chr13g0474081 [Helianthus annuus]KAJ0496968.1 hypothetical protein HanHA89_Chr13g0506001 [Helianthus annuus]KAJ0662998.1 hypothetical protein HanLR1_Chr13g0476151 [Helianthus annuus]